MKKFRILAGILAIVLGTMASTPDTRAGDINGPAMAGLILNNTIPDADLYALGLFVGMYPDKLQTNATDTTTGFSETMTGTYAGQALSVTYTGDSTAFPGGAITWTSTGTYGAETWNGSGAATFSFPTASTFQVAYSSSLTIGSNTVLDNTIISGADNGTLLYYTGATGTLTINNNAPIPAPTPTEGNFISTAAGQPDFDDIEVDGKKTITSLACLDEVDLSPYSPYPPTLIVSSGRISFVPEPSSLVLASFGVLSLLVSYASRHAGKTGV
jgi:hypothetical protein